MRSSSRERSDCLIIDSLLNQKQRAARLTRRRGSGNIPVQTTIAVGKRVPGPGKAASVPRVPEGFLL
jgi:hypothetical protein